MYAAHKLPRSLCLWHLQACRHPPSSVLTIKQEEWNLLTEEQRNIPKQHHLKGAGRAGDAGTKVTDLPYSPTSSSGDILWPVMSICSKDSCICIGSLPALLHASLTCITATTQIAWAESADEGTSRHSNQTQYTHNQCIECMPWACRHDSALLNLIPQCMQFDSTDQSCKTQAAGCTASGDRVTNKTDCKEGCAANHAYPNSIRSMCCKTRRLTLAR